jgi:cellulose synthase/poly-beta-1,6-N-acetylglucosamine synthase-like glycosyltransferase
VRRAVFWSAVGTVATTYVLFPAFVLARARLHPRPHGSAEITPFVTLIVAAHNEAADIGAKLENIIALDYPPDRLQVVIASDGSDDGTDDIVRRFAGSGVQLLSLPRAGKAAALNAAAAVAEGEILVFSDANSIYAEDALRALVKPFADPTVGGVAGDQRYVTDPASGPVSSGEQGYWDFDRVMKSAESSADNVISATGAIYAVRASLFGRVPEGVTDDFYTSTGVIAEGFRLVFAPDAVAFEPVARSANLEFSRKVRVMTRGLRAVLLRRALLNPRRHGLYSVQLFAHKVLRRVMVFPLAAIAVTSPLLWRRGGLYRTATLLQAGFYGLGGLGMMLSHRQVGRRKLLMLPAFFCFVNAAAARATWNAVSGRRIDRWEPQRTVDPEAADERASKTVAAESADR